MIELFRAPRGRLRIAVLAAALAASTLAATSADAQLPAAPQVTPQVQVPDQVQKAIEQPLPEPAQSVVRDTPAEGVRDSVGDVLEDAAGVAGGGGQPAGGGDAGAAATATGPAPAGQSLGSGQSAAATSGGGGAAPTGAGERTSRRAGDGSGRLAARRSIAERRAADPGAAGGAPAASRSDSSADEGGGPVGRTIRRIVEVVPESVKIALAALAALALVLATHTGLERHRRRRLEAEREQLLGDLGLLQSALLPDVPERLGALATSVAYRPADGPGAGGDFYDAFELRDGRVAMIMGDVSGHGREALVWTASVRHSLRTFLRSGLEPRGALAAAASLVSDDVEGHFVTVVVAVHDPATGNLTYAAAGHPPPIVHGAAEHHPITLASSPPLGIDLPTGQRQTTIPLPRGSVVCYFTDGLLEARIGEELIGRERLGEMVAALEDGDGAERLLARVLEESDEASDDMAACLVRAIEGPDASGPRLEELEISADAIELTLAGEFVEACGVPPAAAAEVLEEASAVASVSGGAILLATLDDGDPRVEVIPPRGEREPSELAV